MPISNYKAGRDFGKKLKGGRARKAKAIMKQTQNVKQVVKVNVNTGPHHTRAARKHTTKVVQSTRDPLYPNPTRYIGTPHSLSTGPIVNGLNTDVSKLQKKLDDLADKIASQQKAVLVPSVVASTEPISSITALGKEHIHDAQKEAHQQAGVSAKEVLQPGARKRPVVYDKRFEPIIQTRKHAELIDTLESKHPSNKHGPEHIAELLKAVVYPGQSNAQIIHQVKDMSSEEIEDLINSKFA